MKKTAKNHYIDRRKNGTFRIRVVLYHDGNQVRRSMTYHPSSVLSEKGCWSVAEHIAEDFLEKVKAELKAETGHEYLTFEEYFEGPYAQKAKTYLAPTTYAFYQKVIRKIFLGEYGDVLLKDITLPMVQDTLISLCHKLNDNEDPEDLETIKPQTAKRYMTAFRSVLNFAVEDRLIDINPLAGGLHYPRFEPTNVECLDEADFVKIVKDLTEKIASFECRLELIDVIVALSLLAGTRRGELVALRWSDISNLSAETLDEAKINIAHSAFKAPGHEQEVKTPKSSAGVRMFTVPKLLAAVLLSWKNREGYVAKESDFIITQTGGQMVSVYSPTKWIKDYLTDHGLKDVKLHSLRHTFASMLLETGMDIYTLKDVMGHEKVSTTEIYLKSFKMRNKNLMAFLNTYTAALSTSQEEANEDQDG